MAYWTSGTITRLNNSQILFLRSLGNDSFVTLFLLVLSARTIWGDGRQTRTYCYIDDAARAESDFDRLENIGSDELVSIDELADMIITISGKTIKKKYDVSVPQGVRGRNADITLTREILGWLPNVILQEGLTKTFRWIAAQCRKVD